MQGDPSTAGESALFGLLVLLFIGITFSPDKSRQRRWLFWLGAPTALTVAQALVSHRLKESVIVGLMGLVVLAVTYSIRRLLLKFTKQDNPRTDGLFLARTRLVIGAIGVVLLAWLTWSSYRAGEPGKALVGGLGCLAVANMFAAIKTSDELHEMNVSIDGQGTTFTSPTLQRVLSAMLQLMIGLTLLAWGYQGTGSTWPSEGFGKFFILLLLTMGTILASYGLFKVYDLKHPAFIRVDPSGIRFCQGIRSNRFVAWDDIDRIPPGMPVRNTASYAPSAYVYPSNGRKLIPPPSLGASDNGFRLTNLMLFYWQNPQRRNELTNDHVLQRLQAGDFEPGVDVREP